MIGTATKNITVKELIEILKTKDQNAKLCVEHDTEYFSIEGYRVLDGVEYVSDNGDVKKGNIISFY